MGSLHNNRSSSLIIIYVYPTGVPSQSKSTLCAMISLHYATGHNVVIEPKSSGNSIFATLLVPQFFHQPVWSPSVWNIIHVFLATTSVQDI